MAIVLVRVKSLCRWNLAAELVPILLRSRTEMASEGAGVMSHTGNLALIFLGIDISRQQTAKLPHLVFSAL